MFEIGTVPFQRDAMRASVPEFLDLHGMRPIWENRGGMRAPHLFAAWFMVRTLKPTHIVESGVFKGLGTWLLEHAAPDAELVCIDPEPAARVYHAARARYVTEDFASLSWDLPRETTLLFFDDHQDALRRVEEAQRFGFRHVIFEDNYPPGRGDCFSLKQAFMGERRRDTRGTVTRLLDKLSASTPPPEDPKALLEAALESYYEFPPVLRVADTRWGDPWAEPRYPTPEPLYTSGSEIPGDRHGLFAEEASFYTWICYAGLRARAERSG
jgi:hypothetical protein